MNSYRKRIIPLATSVAALLAASPASAVNLYWDTNGTGVAGSGAHTGTWGTDAFWSTDSTGANVGSPVLTATTTNADDLFFAAGTNGTAGTVTVNGTQAARSITIEEGAVTLNSGTVNLGNSSPGSGMFFPNVAMSINSAIVLNSAATAIEFANRGNQTVTFGAAGGISGSAAGLQTITIGGGRVNGGSFAFNGIISNGSGGGTVGVTINGPAGVLANTNSYTLGAANTYTGATNIIYGALTISNASTFSNTSAISMTGYGRLIVNASNASLAKLASGSGVVTGSFLRYSQTQTAAGSGNGPGTIFGTVELNLTNVNPNYTLDFGAGSALTNLVATTYTSQLSLSGTASIDASPANVTHTATYSTGGITASTSGTKTLNLTGTNTTANTISSAIADGSGAIAVNKGGGGTWLLSGANTYTGNTFVDSGTLQFVNQTSLYNNGAAATWTKNNIIVGRGATMAFSAGGAGQFTKDNINTLLGLSDSASNGFTSGSNVGIDTTGGNLLFDSAIANTNSGNNVLGLTKLGTNTLTLDQNNTYTGRTIISAGTLQIGTGGTTGKLSASSSILNNGTISFNRSDAVAQGTDFSAAPIAGTGAFIQAGAANITLNAANTFSGTTTVSTGTLTLSNALALQNSALVTTGAGSVILSSVTTPTFGGLSGATGNLSTVISSGYNSVTGITLNTVGAGSFTYGGVISDGTGAISLTKTGTGTQILSGANSYTGATIVSGGTLTVGSGASGSLSSSSALQVGGGAIFNYSRTGAGQTVSGLTINSGNSTVNNTSAGQTLTLGAISRTGSVNGTVNFATLTGPISTTTGNTNSIIGPWATTGSGTALQYAVGSADGTTPTNISSLTGTTATAGTLANVTSASGNFEYSAAATTSADLTANTLRYSGASTATAIGASNTLTLNGLMNAGTGALTVSGGPSTGGVIIGSTNELVVTSNTQTTTISSVIKDGGAAGRLVYSGAGTLTLNGLNTYSGGLVINSGIVTNSVSATTSSGPTGTGPITINAGGRLTLNSAGVSTLDRSFTINGGSLFFAGSGADLTAAGTIVLNANSTIDASNTNSGFPTITANMSGVGGFTKTGTGGLRLNGTNTYSGPTVVSVGGLTVKSSLYGNDTTKWTPANITVASGATLVLNVGGTGEFSLANAALMFSQLSSNVNNNGLQAGSFIGVDTRNAAAGTYTYSAIITDSTGAGGGSVSFKHTGTPSTILELTGNNTYSGMSVVDNGSFLRVSSLNSVFTNPALGTVHSASSSLGAPTTVANGTIHLGTGGSTAQSGIGNTFQAAGLIYTGTGETTDRVISLNDGGTSGTPSILDQSGTGHLKFINPFSSLDNRGPKTLELRGSTAGTAELAGSIADSGNNLKLNKTGTGTWVLSGPNNSYAGVTTINGGTLRFAKQGSLYNNTPASWLKTNIIVNTGGTLAFNVGGTNEFTNSDVTTLLSNLAVGINNNGLRSGSSIGFDTTNASGGTFTIGNILANSTGTDGGAIGMRKLGTGTLVLSAVNTYTGATNISAGTLLVSGSLSGSSAVSVTGSGTLGGTGTVGGASGPVTVSSGAFLQGGDGVAASGALTLAGNLTLNDGATIKLTLGAALAHSTLSRTGGTWAFDSDQAFLFNSGAPLGTYDNIITGLTGSEVGLATIATWTLNSEYAGSTFTYDGAGGVDLTLVPEPGSALMLAGGLATLLGFRRRRLG